MNWEIAASVILAVGAATGVAIQLREVIPRHRSKLKTELEMLDLMPEDAPHRALILESIGSRVELLYGRSSKRRIHRPGELLAGILWMLLFAGWAAYLAQGPSPYWAVLPAIAAFIGIGGVVNGFEPNAETDTDEE